MSCTNVRALKLLLPQCPKCIAGATSFRKLNLQEYQSKSLMREFKLNVQPFHVADSIKETERICKIFPCEEYVVKAMVLAGGRGKGKFLENGFEGGVKLTTKTDEVISLASKMIGNHLVTHQTTSTGVKVNKVMIAESYRIVKEAYFAIVMDREMGGPVLVGSSQGGVDIEEVAASNPEAIFKIPVDVTKGITQQQALEAAEKLSLDNKEQELEAADQIKKLFHLFSKVDATQVEINPFGLTEHGRVVMFDAKINFDDNAEFRQKEIFALDDKSLTDEKEVAAQEAKLNYISMDGNIACVVNGAGLAMATMDIIKLHGGDPANFLDVGGSVTEEQVLEAFKIMSMDDKVKTIFINIFAGIVDCVVVAKGLIESASKLGLKVPLVVRLVGRNADEALKILGTSGLNIISQNELDHAAKEAVQAAAQSI